MTWATKYHLQQKKYWPEVEQFFSKLPPHLFRQGVLLKNNLATFYSDSGQFKDILCREQDLPLRYLHLWLLDDFHFPPDAERTSLEKHLLLAMAFTFAGIYTQQSILDAGSQFDNSYLFLERALTRQAGLHLAQLYPGQSSFWEHHQACWHEYAEAHLAAIDPHRLTSDPADPFLEAGKLSFTKIPVAAVTLSANQETILPQLCTMMDHLNVVFQTVGHISTIRRDVVQRNYTYPLIRAMQAAGLDPNQSVPAERILGALVLTGTVAELGQECLAHLEACRAISTSLNLPTFTGYWAVVENLVAEIMALFSLNKPKAHAREKKKQSPFFAPAIDTLTRVVDMAEGYLLSDLTFRESWEVQRRGVFGLPEMTGRAFPSGLIIEILCQQGHDLATGVDMVFDTLQATGIRYYDHDHLPPDTDDLGLLLRLYPYSTQPDIHRQILQRPVTWLDKNVTKSGEIPVWLMQNEREESEQRFVALWGQSCAAVEANLLLGLIAYDWTAYAGLIEKSALNLFERWQKKGLGATTHYVPLYSIWVASKLVCELAAKPISIRLQKTLAQAAQTLADQLANETKRPSLTPLAAAFLTLSCFAGGRPVSIEPVFKPEWITLLAKSQRYDGSWAGEALFGTPTRGELATWYTSRAVTTAFCYHALKTYQVR